MLAVLCRLLICLCGDRLLTPWSWTAHVGEPWDTFDVAPWNLYNGLWCLGQWVWGQAAADGSLGERV